MNDDIEEKELKGYCNKNKTYQSFLNALPYSAAILNDKGIILCVNEKWKKFPRNNNLFLKNYGIGTNFINISKKAEGEDTELAAEAAEGIRAVISEEKDLFTMEYSCTSDEKKHWFQIKVKAFKEGALVLHENITEKKLGKEKSQSIFEKLKETEKLLERTFDSIQDGISILNPDLTIRHTNQTMKEWYHKNTPLEGKKCYQVYHNREEPCENCSTLRCMETKAVESEIVSGLESSEIEYLELYNYPMIDEKTGEVEGVVKFLRDITERKRTQKKLQESRKNLEATLNSIGDAVIATDTDGYITRMNPVAEKLTDWSLGNAEGKPLSEVFKIVNAKSKEPVTNPVHEVLQTGEKVGLANHTMLISKKGEEYQIADSASPIRDNEGNIMGIVLVFRDVTEEYRMRQQIIEQKNFLSSILETQSGLVVVMNKKGEIIRFNKACEELTGYSLEEVKGKNLFDIFIKEEEKKEVKQIFKELNNQNYPNQFENYWLTKEGKERLISWSNNVILDDKNEIKYVVGTGIDITDRQKREEKIRHMSYHDSLTDLYNRTYMEEEIERLNHKSELPLSIIMVDINGLKIINEGYGHKKGDQVLIETAALLHKNVREKDIVARWTGDEFIILLPRTREEQTQAIMEKIRKKARSTQSKDIPLSLGIGYALKTDPEQDIYEILYKAEDYVYRDKLTKNRSLQNKLVQNMLNTLGAKSDETKAHAQRMTELSYKLGQKIGLSNEELNHLSLLATLHDVGKVNIAEEILKKPDKLTDEEWEVIKEHTEKGYSIASAIEEFTPIAESILSHHERWDGDGYPQGLAGEEIPLLARIITIVDAYDVMTNGRPYKEPLSKKEAIKELKRCAGTQFDPELVEEFVEVIT